MKIEKIEKILKYSVRIARGLFFAGGYLFLVIKVIEGMDNKDPVTFGVFAVCFWLWFMFDNIVRKYIKYKRAMRAQRGEDFW